MLGKTQEIPLAAASETERPRPQPDRPITVRRVKPHFDAVDEIQWFRGDRFRTDLYNAYTLLLADEFEFVASVRKFLPKVKDEKLLKQLKAWLGQETTHGVQHTDAQVYFDRVGLRHRMFHKVEHFVYYRALVGLLGPRLMLALIAGLEHFNTLLGEMCLCRPDYFDGADSELSLLLRWHFAEEIEHRAVIHDVAEHVGIGYTTRVITGVLAFILYSGTLFATTLWFSLQSGSLLRPSAYRSAFRFFFVEERFVSYFVTYLRDYFRRDFHPLHRDTDGLVERALSQVPVFNRAGSALPQPQGI